MSVPSYRTHCRFLLRRGVVSPHKVQPEPFRRRSGSGLARTKFPVVHGYFQKTQQVPRRVQVPIQLKAALRAAVRALAERKLGAHRPAGAAPLAGREEPVGDREPDPVDQALVPELPPELVPAHVGDVPGQMPVAHHPADGQVLDRHRLVLAAKSGGQPVQCVFADVPDAPVQSGQAEPGLLQAWFHCKSRSQSLPLHYPGL